MITATLYLCIFAAVIFLLIGMCIVDDSKELIYPVCVSFFLLLGLVIHNEVRNSIIQDIPYTYTKLDVAELNSQMIVNSYNVVRLDDSIPKGTKAVYRKEKKVPLIFVKPDVKYVLNEGD